MARSKGYRPRKEQREEVQRLRGLLSKLHHYQWQRANAIMDRIVELTGKESYGPSGSKIEPRACKYCRFYGHTKKYCPKRIAALDAYYEEVKREDQLLRERATEKKEEYRPDDSWQAREFRRLEIPYVIDPTLGPMIASGFDYGKWKLGLI